MVAIERHLLQYLILVAMGIQWLPWKGTSCYGKLMVAMASHSGFEKSIVSIESHWLLWKAMVVMESHWL
jgi:hypothetical protein